VAHAAGASVCGGVETRADDAVWSQTGVAVPSGVKFLRVMAWMKAEDVRSSTGAVAVHFHDADGASLQESLVVAVSADCDWSRYVGYAAVPEGTVTVSAHCFVGYAFTKCGRFWWDDLELCPVDAPIEPVTQYIDDTPPPVPTGEEKERGFILFSRPPQRAVFPNAVPLAHERIEELSVSACPGEREPVVLILHALHGLTGLQVTVGALSGLSGEIPATATEVRSVRYMRRSGQTRWGPFNETIMHDVPQFLERRDSLTINAGRSQPYWLTVAVPEDARPGRYAGLVRVTLAGKTMLEMPLAVDVRPFTLANPEGTFFGMYARMRDDAVWLREMLADLRAHGMNGLALCGASGIPMALEDGRVALEWTGASALEKNLTACKGAGFTEPMLWLMSHTLPNLCKQAGPIESEAFAEAYCSAIEGIVARGKEAGWPEIIFQPVDEPFEWEQRMAENQRLLELLKSIAGVRTEGDGMNGKWGNFTPDVYALTDVINLHDGPMLDRHTAVDMRAWRAFRRKTRADGKLIWFYNIDLTAWHPEPVRYMTGFGLWKADADGIIEWCYMCPVDPAAPEAVYSNPAALLYRYPAAPGESGGPTVAYEAAREGVDDYRYLLTLRQRIRRAHREGPDAARELADEAWKDVRTCLAKASFNGCTGVAMQGNWTGKCEVLPDGRRVVRGDHKVPNGWEFHEYDALRGRIAHYVEELDKLLGTEGRQ